MELTERFEGFGRVLNDFDKIMYVDQTYNKTRHLLAEAQAVLAAVRLNYWPLNGRNTVHSALRRCLICFKANPSRSEQRMDDLSDYRVNIYTPFLATGVDYAGPLDMKDGNRKGYVCLFVCF
ncbi:hypothetical protein Trydic_g22669 [Trypoxylus dichotomus]